MVVVAVATGGVAEMAALAALGVLVLVGAVRSSWLVAVVHV